jgi:hypothetical protein
MGLLCSTEDKTRSENHSVFKAELEIGFSHHTPHSLLERIKPKIQDGLITQAAFDEVTAQLHLFRNPKTKEAFLTQLRKADKLDGDLLLVFALLTSRGSKVERARSIWSCFDSSKKESFTRPEFENILKLLVKASIDLTFKAAVAGGAIQENRLTVYKDDLQKRRDGFVKDMLTGFIGTQEAISRAVFVARAQEQAMDVTTTLTVRRGIEKVKYEPTAFKSAFARKKAELGV